MAWHYSWHLALSLLRSPMCAGPLWGSWAHRFPSKVRIIADIMISKLFAVVRSMFEILIQNFLIFSCGWTMSRRAHRVRILRLSVFRVQLRGIAPAKFSFPKCNIHNCSNTFLPNIFFVFRDRPLFSFFFQAGFVDFSHYRGTNLRVASDSFFYFSSSTVDFGLLAPIFAR